MNKLLSTETKQQILQCIDLLKDVFSNDLLGVYLYGSSIIGGLQKYSDIDIFVISNRSTTTVEKSKLIKNLLIISGIYKKNIKRPIEMTIVVKADLNPWQYPPKFDFQYGDWLRAEFESGNIEPWPSKEMPDLAILITQILLANKKLLGANVEELITSVPYQDFILATQEALKSLLADLKDDTCNVLLTLARIWSTVQSDAIRSKPGAALWATPQLPDKLKPVMKRAKAICIGEENELWDDLDVLLLPCALYMIEHINKQILLNQLCADKDKSLYYIE